MVKSIKLGLEKVARSLLDEAGFHGAEIPDFIFAPAPDFTGADYACNLAFPLAKLLKKDPEETASLVRKEALKEMKNVFQQIEIQKGFLNLYLKPSFLQLKLKNFLRTRRFSLQTGAGRRVHIDFISINPTGKLHIGHGRGAFFGDALGNLLQAVGYRVFKEYYVNDAKTSTQIKQLGRTVLGKGTEYKSDYLVRLIKKLRKEGRLSKELLSQSEEEVGYFMAQEILKELKNFIEDILHIHFDAYFSEEQLWQKGEVERTLEKLKKQNLVYIKEGALWLMTSKFGDDKDRVLVRKDGRAGYFLPDIAYHLNKFKRGFDLVIDIWGADHQGHKKRMEAMAKIFGFEDKLKILIHQMVLLKTPQGLSKFSKRAGNIVDLEDLVNEVGLDVTRFMMLSTSLGSNMIFDLAKAKEKSMANPVYYIQYAIVRVKGILKKLAPIKESLFSQELDLSVLDKKEELALIRKIFDFPVLLEEISASFRIHQLCSFLQELAGQLHGYYEKYPIASQSGQLRRARLALVVAVKEVLEKGFRILGISCPDKM